MKNIEVKPRSLALTHQSRIMHPSHGVCEVWIFRAVGNDSGVTAQRTLDQLKDAEPHVGLWPGDIIQYRNGSQVLEEIKA